MVVVPKLVNIKQTLLMDLHSVEKATKLTKVNYSRIRKKSDIFLNHCCSELGANKRMSNT